MALPACVLLWYLYVAYLDTTPVFFYLTELTIGWERNLTTVNESHGTLELCIIIKNVTENDTLTGFSVMLFKRTIRGTAAGKLSYIDR